MLVYHGIDEFHGMTIVMFTQLSNHVIITGTYECGTYHKLLILQWKYSIKAENNGNMVINRILIEEYCVGFQLQMFVPKPLCSNPKINIKPASNSN